MKTMLKPLSLAAAVAAVTAGYAGVTQAQTTQIANNGLGDMAVVPYYTVEGDFVSGVHIINTGGLTEVVKLRLRRGSDSMDALDFNIVLSPYDEWTGFVDDSSGQVVMATDDNSCTAPLRADGRFAMPSLYSEGATEGYIEVIGMGSADASQAISAGARHGADGVPLDCEAVESNFFRNATFTPPATIVADLNAKGITSSSTANQTCSTAVGMAMFGPGYPGCIIANDVVFDNTFTGTGNVLKVSFFHRDATSGLEFGNSAVHLADFNSGAPMMTNQEVIVVGGSDPWGYLFPDLDGGSPVDSVRGQYDAQVRPALGATSVVNDWSVASARNVSTDWVVTLPGQYLMLDLARYTVSLFDATVECLPAILAAAAVPVQPVCDARDLPVTLSIDWYDREEQQTTTPGSGLVISPEVNVPAGDDSLEYEVNVIQWTDGSSEAVLPSQYAKSYDVTALGAENGWASLGVTSSLTKAPQAVWDFAISSFGPAVTTPVPIVGFVAWERSFPSDPSANYGRIVEHSYEQTVVTP